MLGFPGYTYATSENRVFINLYVSGRARVPIAGGNLVLEQVTNYPWDGDIRVKVSPAKAGRFSLMLRIPGWARQLPVPSDLYRQLGMPVPADAVTLEVNGQEVPLTLDKGYAVVDRDWNTGDEIALHLPMPIRRVVANQAVKADAGRVAVERGPLVYAAEWPDNNGHVINLMLEDSTPLTSDVRPGLLGGVTVVTGTATAFREQRGAIVSSSVPLTLIPYYAWAHRGKGQMAVWLAREPGKATPVPVGFSAGIEEWKVR